VERAWSSRRSRASSARREKRIDNIEHIAQCAHMASSRVTVELDDEDREHLAEVLERLKRGRPGEVVTVSDAVREAIRGESKRSGGIKRDA
jgi:hypothetical protein